MKMFFLRNISNLKKLNSYNQRYIKENFCLTNWSPFFNERINFLLSILLIRMKQFYDPEQILLGVEILTFSKTSWKPFLNSTPLNN